jgi:hypothetical protein
MIFNRFIHPFWEEMILPPEFIYFHIWEGAGFGMKQCETIDY